MLQYNVNTITNRSWWSVILVLERLEAFRGLILRMSFLAAVGISNGHFLNGIHWCLSRDTRFAILEYGSVPGEVVLFLLPLEMESLQTTHQSSTEEAHKYYHQQIANMNSYVQTP